MRDNAINSSQKFVAQRKSPFHREEGVGLVVALAIAFGLLCLWGIFSLITSSVQSHFEDKRSQRQGVRKEEPARNFMQSRPPRRFTPAERSRR